MSFIKGRNEPPCHFTNTFKIFDIVSLIAFNCLTMNIFLHSSKRFFNIFDIGG